MTAVVVSHNYAHYLRQAIESLLEQVPSFSEIIVVDDGSTDDSLQVARQYEPRVTVISKENGGQGSACLAALKICRTEYIYFLDADDYALPGLSGRLAEVVEARPVKIQFRLHGVDASGAELNSRFPSFPHGYTAAQMREDNVHLGFYICPPTSGNVYRCDTLRAATASRLDPREPLDGAVGLTMPYRGEVASLQDVLGAYRVHADSFSGAAVVTAAVLRREVAVFNDRWKVACGLLERPDPPCAAATPGYVAERELMAAALDGTFWVVPSAARFVLAVRRSCLPVEHKVAGAVFAILLAVPCPPLRRYAVTMRRVAGSRPRIARRIVAFVQSGTRRTEDSAA